MSDPKIHEVIKQLVLANEDSEIQAIAAVVITKEGELEFHISMAAENGYRIIAGMEILKYNVVKQILDDAARPLEDRS